MVHAGIKRSQFSELSEALYLTQGFLYPDAETAEARFKGENEGFIYARYGSPTVSMFQDRIADLEGAEAAFATASGMAAMNACMFSQLSAGDHVVASRALFGSCLHIIDILLPRFGIQTTLVDGRSLDAWRAAVQPNTKVFFLETPANPTLELIDIAGVAEIARKANACLVVDNVFATPIFQHPLELGADVVMYSATKHIDGQGRCLGGVVLGTQEFITDKIEAYCRHTGAAISPFNAWVMLKGMETLDLRCRAQTDSAEFIADQVSDHPKINKLLYPTRSDHPQYEIAKKQMERGGTVIAVEVKGGQEGAFKFLNALNIFKLSNNLGDAKSLATHPATTTHQKVSLEMKEALGISLGLVRLSVGLEDPQDLLDDIRDALDAITV
jgi:O-succinylhomoserine sulfhydrylase